MRSDGYSTWFVSVCVCPFVCFLQLRATRQRNSDTNMFIATLASFLKRPFWYNFCVLKLWHERQVNMPICKLAQAYLDRVRLLCVSWRHKKSQWRACIDSRMLSTTVASPCQTLRELLAWRTSLLKKPSPSISGTVRAHLAKDLHFT